MAYNVVGNLENNFIQKTLNERNSFSKVYDISGGYNKFTQFTSTLNPGGSKQVDSVKYEKSKRGNLGVVAQIQSNSLVGTSLVIVFSDPTYEFFRVGDTVADSNNVLGNVTVAGPGTITVSPITVTFVAATHFIANMFAKVFFNTSLTRNSVGVTSLYNTPDLDYNYTGLTRDTTALARKDFISTYVKVGGKYWWCAQQLEMVARMGKMTEFKFVFSERADVGGKQYNGGIIWSIKNRGGEYVSSTAAITQPVLQGLIQGIKTRNPGTTEVTMFAGAGAIASFQSFMTPLIQFVGVNSTFGMGTKSGLDVMMYNWLGVKLNIVPLDLFNDPKLFQEISTITGTPKQGNAFFIVDASPIPAVDGGTLPAIERFHFGPTEMMSTYTPGMIGTDGGNASSTSQMNYNMSANDIDGVTFNVGSDNGIDILDAKAMCYFELAS